MYPETKATLPSAPWSWVLFEKLASLAYGREVLHLLWNPNIYLHPLESVLSHFNQVDTFTLFFLKSWAWTSGFRFLTESGSLFLPYRLL